MVVAVMDALQKEGINHVSLIAFAQNDVGNTFWNTIGWQQRQDLNYYDFILNTENITQFNVQQLSLIHILCMFLLMILIRMKTEKPLQNMCP